MKMKSKGNTDDETDTDATISLHESDEDIIVFDEIDIDDWETNNEDTSIIKETDPLLNSVIAATSLESPSKTNVKKEKYCKDTSVMERIDPLISMTPLQDSSTNFEKDKVGELLCNESFVVVKFGYNEDTKKRTEKHFMAQVIDSSESHVSVKVMRK